ncbi:hypothetical protein AF72_09835 [Xylella taiwanensis]|uniref:Uncharacterized protein n=1 Tax=Xylella taiwanensis TaxID=1444770 RepID=Z9JHF2_9GAMM|nr:hypothetical protein AF72_09835 [Xylella taiwanensis]
MSWLPSLDGLLMNPLLADMSSDIWKLYPSVCGLIFKYLMGYFWY